MQPKFDSMAYCPGGVWHENKSDKNVGTGTRGCIVVYISRAVSNYSSLLNIFNFPNISINGRDMTPNITPTPPPVSTLGACHLDFGFFSAQIFFTGF